MNPMKVNRMRFLECACPGTFVLSIIMNPRPPIVNRKLLAKPSIIYCPLMRYGIKATYWLFIQNNYYKFNLNCLNKFWNPHWSGMSVFVCSRPHWWRFHDDVINYPFNSLSIIFINNSEKDYFIFSLTSSYKKIRQEHEWENGYTWRLL